MSTETPSSTPVKKLPMIVDIAIDNNGKKMYQVHETSKLVRKEMPTSTRFAESAPTQGEEKTPIKRMLGTLLPTSTNQKPRIEVDTRFEPAPTSRKNSYEDIAANPNNSTPTSTTSSQAGDSEKDIWSSDVQDAFEEVLSIVPKNGLNKIKIGGRSCGRNELVSDYILAKTGKFRSRKQVSSHIQVIKNMGLKKNLIQLINDGPVFATPDEAEDNARAFEEIFTKINLNKSLGVVSMSNISPASLPERRRLLLRSLVSAPKRHKPLFSSFVSVRNSCFSIESQDDGSGPIMLTLQDDSPAKSLTIKENVNVSQRFPGLDEFANSSVPILHTMMRIYSPLQLPPNYSIDNGLKTNYMLDFGQSLPAGLSSFTSVYSFGSEVLKVNEDHFDANVNQPFLLKFWKCFFLQLLLQPYSLDAAFKGITVKQVVYDSVDGPSGLVPKSKVRAVLLWEFTKVDDLKDAISNTSRLFLPPSVGFPTVSPTNYNHQPPTFQQALPPPLEHDVFSSDGHFPSHDFKLEQQFAYQPVLQMQPYASLSYPPTFQLVYHPSANVDLTSVRSNQEEQFGYQEFEFGGQYR